MKTLPPPLSLELQLQDNELKPPLLHLCFLLLLLLPSSGILFLPKAAKRTSAANTGADSGCQEATDSLRSASAGGNCSRR